LIKIIANENYLLKETKELDQNLLLIKQEMIREITYLYLKINIIHLIVILRCLINYILLSRLSNIR